MPKKAFIIVDMLNDFVDEKGALYCGESVQPIVLEIKNRLDNYRRNKDTIIFLADSHDKEDKEFERFPDHCVTGTWGSRIVSELSPLPDEVIIPKQRFSGFFNTPLERILKKKDIEEVEVAGVCTSICVMDTIGGLANRDYKIKVCKKCVADFDAQFHEFALKRMQQTYGAEII